jgi:hypothetical protein
LPRKRLEKKGSDRLRKEMAARGWFTVKIPGGTFLSGFPDIFAAHPTHGIKLIETKKGKGGKLSDSQVAMFNKLDRAGVKIYIMYDERDYDKLFNKPNWKMFALGYTNIAMPKGLQPSRKDRLDQ